MTNYENYGKWCRDVDNAIDQCVPELIDDIRALVSIPSTEDLASAGTGKPFGENVQKVFLALKAIAEKKDLPVRDFDGYAVDITIGSQGPLVGILNHIDVVPSGNIDDWSSNPFELAVRGDELFGRGVTDNKGPLIASLHLLHIFNQLRLPLNKRVRLIIGGAEETSWNCLRHYFKQAPQPDFAFSPDGDFPIVNSEKGIVQFTLKKSGYLSNPNQPCRLGRIWSDRDFSTNCHKLFIELIHRDDIKQHRLRSVLIRSVRSACL